MKSIGIIGSGTMGSGIAHVSAISGFNTFLLDLDSNLLEKGLKKIKNNLFRQVKKEKIHQKDLDIILNRIILTKDYSDLSNCDIIIEAVTEKESIKKKIFNKLDNICKSSTILTTNTSSISITKLADHTSRPGKIIGMHFMNPVPIMKLIEVIRGQKTEDTTVKAIFDLSIKMNKTPVLCNDSPGFISNRILMPMINEAIYCLMEGVATREAIDEIMQLGMSHPMGPLKLADLIGLDVCRDILIVLHNDFKDKKYEPCPILDQMVKERKLGKKTGEGFYKYL